MGQAAGCPKRDTQTQRGFGIAEIVGAGKWAESNCLTLCSEGQEYVFDGKARIFPASHSQNLTRAVAALNTGYFEYEEGFCVILVPVEQKVPEDPEADMGSMNNPIFGPDHYGNYGGDASMDPYAHAWPTADGPNQKLPSRYVLVWIEGKRQVALDALDIDCEKDPRVLELTRPQEARRLADGQTENTRPAEVGGVHLEVEGVEMVSPSVLGKQEGVKVEFLVSGKLVSKVLTKTPFGMTFSKTSEMTVAEISQVVPDGHAHDLGIEVGWQFKTIDGKSVEGQSLAEMSSFLKDKASEMLSAMV